MKSDFRHQLLIQIEMFRGEVSHSQLSERLGDIAERSLARYIAGKSYLTEKEFREVAKALGMDAERLARAWAADLRLRIPNEDVVSEMLSRARLRWRQRADCQACCPFSSFPHGCDSSEICRSAFAPNSSAMVR
jgi:hypothetical protein